MGEWGTDLVVGMCSGFTNVDYALESIASHACLAPGVGVWLALVF